jgi:hypothetical protein
MHSWDLFDTLVAGRDICTPCGDQPEGSHFPILENVLKVMPGDVVASDYCDSAKANRILLKVARLNNRLYVGNGIKSTGEFWTQIGVEHHTADRPYKISAALQAGIKATPVQLSLFTPAEQELYDVGLRGLASTLREARLISYDREYRPLQLLQNQANFPFLFLASILLHRKLTVQKLNRVLMCSRDAFLWHQLQEKVQNLHNEDSYEIRYFYTSRLTRYFPSLQVLEYTRRMLSDRTLIVDVCGSGRSLERFSRHLTPKPSLWLLVGYGPSMSVPHAIQWLGSTTIEMANFARHPMVCDMAHESDDTFVPVFVNPKSVAWANVPEINVMHEAFALAISVMPNYSFASDLRIDEGTLTKMVRKLFQRIEDRSSFLTAFAKSFFGPEEAMTRQVLRTLWNDSHRS